MHLFFRYRPALISILLGAAVIFGYTLFNENKQSQAIARINQDAIKDLTRLLNDNLDHQIFYLDWMAKQWLTFGRPSPFLWREQAAHIVKHHDYLQAVEWADTQKVIRWVEPVMGNQAAVNLDLSKLDPLNDGLNQALVTGQPYFVSYRKLVQGKYGNIIYFPIGREPNNHGFIIGVSDSTSFMQTSVNELLKKDFEIRVLYQSNILFNNFSEDSYYAYTRIPIASSSVKFGNEIWQVYVRPSPALYEKLTNDNSAYVLLAMLLFSCLLATLTQMFFSARRYNRHLSRINSQLEGEIIEREKIEQDMQLVSSTDELTGLINRTAFHQKVNQHLVQPKKRQVALILIDLDKFQQVNDAVGHNAGDMLLRQVSHKIKRILDEDTMLSRIGGDEFAIYLNNINGVVHLERLAQRLLKSLNDTFVLDEYEFRISASIGYVLTASNCTNADELAKQADLALNRAKHMGRNCIFQYTNEIQNDILNQVSLLKSLYQALDQQQFELFYQPKIDLNDGKIVGIEALVRWYDTENEDYIPPLEFIPLCEESGLILPLGDWIIEQACYQLSEWHAAGFPHLSMAINVSGKQFSSNQLYHHIVQCYQKHLLPANKIEIELTEEVFVENIKRNSDFMLSLVEQGVSIALDDFGIGYSSLSYLKNFPLHTIKIDRTFVRDIQQDDSSISIVKTIIELARQLDMRIIAEGIETQEQHKILSDLGCHHGQGYYYARPMTAQQLSTKLNNDEPWIK